MTAPVDVFGVLSDIADIPLRYNPQIVFRPNRPATNLTSFTVDGVFRSAGGALYATSGVAVTPSAGGYFTNKLHPTSDLVDAEGGKGRITYTVSIVWTDPVEGRTARDFIEGLQISDTGGAIGSQIKTSLPGGLIWAGPDFPAQYRVPGNIWWDTDSENHDVWMET